MLNRVDSDSDLRNTNRSIKGRIICIIVSCFFSKRYTHVLTSTNTKETYINGQQLSVFNLMINMATSVIETAITKTIKIM